MWARTVSWSSDDEWEFINLVRGSLPERILLKPNGSGQSYPKMLTKEWLARTIEQGPLRGC